MATLMVLETLLCGENFLTLFALIFYAFMSLHVHCVMGTSIESSSALIAVKAENSIV